LTAGKNSSVGPIQGSVSNRSKREDPHASLKKTEKEGSNKFPRKEGRKEGKKGTTSGSGKMTLQGRERESCTKLQMENIW